jgi:hypothetical protein
VPKVRDRTARARLLESPVVALRRHHGLSPDQAAEQLGISVLRLARLEAATRRLPTSALAVIAERLAPDLTVMDHVQAIVDAGEHARRSGRAAPMRDRTGPGPTLRTVLQALNARGYEVGLDDDGHRMSVLDAAGRRAWLGYGRVMRFEAGAGGDVAFALELNGLLAELPNEYAPAAWREVGVDDADLAWQLERFGVRPDAYMLARLAGLRDLPAIAAKYGLPSASSEARDDA